MEQIITVINSNGQYNGVEALCCYGQIQKKGSQGLTKWHCDFMRARLKVAEGFVVGGGQPPAREEGVLIWAARLPQ